MISTFALIFVIIVFIAVYVSSKNSQETERYDYDNNNPIENTEDEKTDL